jgi:hypothetical protein
MPTQDHNDELQGVLRDAVAQLRAAQPPAEAQQRALARLAAPPGHRQAPAGAFFWRYGLAVAACLAVGLLSIAAFQYISRTPEDRGVAVARQDDPKVMPRTNTLDLSDPMTLNLDGARLTEGGPDGRAAESRQFGAVASGADLPRGPAPASRARFAGAMPSRSMSVAHNSTVLVSTGADEPITLGQAVPTVAQPGGMPHKIHVWDWSASDKSRVLDAAVSGAFAVSPDGTAVVTHDGRVVDVASGASKKIEGFDGNVRGIRFSPGGKTLLLQVQRGQNASVARLLEFPTGKKLSDIENFWHYTFAAEFSADGTQVLLTGADRVVRRFDAASGRELARYEPALDNSVRTIVVSRDGSHVAAAGTRGEIYLWKIEGGQPLHKLVAHQKPDPESLRRVVRMEFSNDGRLLAGGGLQNLVLWDTETGQVERIYPTTSGQAAHIRFSGDGKSITAVHDFYGTGDRKTGADALVYPRVQKWDIE